jgi:hypothetical protein
LAAVLWGSHTAAPSGWLIGLCAWVLATVLQSTILGAAFVLLVLSGRQGTTFIPKRDYHYFIASLTPLTGEPRMHSSVRANAD